MASSPTSRSLEECKRRGWRACVVERWMPQAGRRIDLFGFIDIVALDGEPGLIGIQATSTGNAPARVKKIREECWEAASDWLAAGNRVVVWGWSKRGLKGKRKLWRLKEYEVSDA